MKKRVLSLVMIIPVIIMLLTFGFSNSVNLFVDLQPEFLSFEYDEEQAFEYTSANADGINLEASVEPLNATNKDVVWSLEVLSDDNEEGAPGPAAEIVNGKLIRNRDCVVKVTATVSGTSLSKSFTAYLVDAENTGAPRYVLINGADTVESAIEPYQYRYKNFGLYDVVGGSKALHTETFEIKVIPLAAAQKASVEINVGNNNGTVVFDPEKDLTAEANVYKLNLHFAAASEGNIILSAKAGEVTSERFYFKVIDGVNVKTYDDLLFCTPDPSDTSREPEAIVLRGNLESKENLSKPNSSLFGREGGKCDYREILSTYDIRHYIHNGKTDEAKIKVGITFRKNVYGNGYTINAHELTYPTQIINQNGVDVAALAASDPYRGPLKFVEEYGCCCYGQDNIGFMVQGDDIVIDNVTLKNCNNVNNLSNLDYVGTVLEVDGDNVTVQYSQIMNGRTVVRTMSNQNLHVKNCLLSYAREFILKVGSNRFLYPESGMDDKTLTFAKLAPTAGYDENGNYVDLLENKKNGKYDSTATVEDTYFYTSGVFCIGMDTHFAGRYLYKFHSSVHDLAATSYPSKLDLVGDVRLYDWKKVDNLDSSTLITTSSDYSGLFDVKSVINYFYDNNRDGVGKDMILETETGERFVHGGVAFFGGGRNLSEVDFSGLEASAKAMFISGASKDTFHVALNDESLGLSAILVNAAGYGEFKFYMYNPQMTEITIDSAPTLSDLSA